VSLFAWVLFYIFNSLVFKWILSWGGAEKIEGLLSTLFFGFFTLDFNKEQLRFLALILWFFSTVIFILGLFNTDIR